MATTKVASTSPATKRKRSGVSRRRKEPSAKVAEWIADIEKRIPPTGGVRALWEARKAIVVTGETLSRVELRALLGDMRRGR